MSEWNKIWERIRSICLCLILVIILWLLANYNSISTLSKYSSPNVSCSFCLITPWSFYNWVVLILILCASISLVAEKYSCVLRIEALDLLIVNAGCSGGIGASQHFCNCPMFLFVYFFKCSMLSFVCTKLLTYETSSSHDGWCYFQYILSWRNCWLVYNRFNIYLIFDQLPGISWFAAISVFFLRNRNSFSH